MTPPTAEQEKIINYALKEKGNCVVVAKPGSGKTFTLAKIITQLIPSLPIYAGVIAISYTNKASDELERRCLSAGLMPQGSFFGTIDKFFIREIIFPFLPHLWGSPTNQLAIKKINDVVEAGDLDEETQKLINEEMLADGLLIKPSVLKILEKLFNQGTVLLNTVGKLAHFVYEGSLACRRYLKSRYKCIIVDEYQDSGYEQHSLFKKLSENGLHAIAVGDFDQAIYRFAKKDARFLRDLTKNANFKTFPITRNHRCHPSIINYSLRLMDENSDLIDVEEKRVAYRQVTGSEEECATWIDQYIPKIKEKIEIQSNNKIAILCRGIRTINFLKGKLKTPYVHVLETPLDIDAETQSVVFADILYTIFDPALKKTDFISKYFNDNHGKNAVTAAYEFLDQLKVIAKDSPQKLSGHLGIFEKISDLIDENIHNEKSSELLSAVLSSQDSLRAYMPAKDEEIILMTLHKSKGLEFDFVIHMDLYDYIMPGYKAIKENDQEEYTQDLNLHYVGITRAKKACLLLSSTLRHNSQDRIVNATASSFLSLNGVEKLR